MSSGEMTSRDTSWHPPRALVLSWLGLMALLAITVTLAYLPLGSANTVIALSVATLKALLIAAVFMELRERGGIMIAFAGAGFFWLAILLWLAFADYVTRPDFRRRALCTIYDVFSGNFPVMAFSTSPTVRAPMMGSSAIST